jgi:hypothetical protein
MYRPGAEGYPGMPQHLAFLRESFSRAGGFASMDRKQMIEILAPRSPYELDAMRYHYRRLTNNNDIGVSLDAAMRQSCTSERLHMPVLGLALGPYLFDIWLINSV